VAICTIFPGSATIETRGIQAKNYIRSVWQRCKWKRSVSGRWMYMMSDDTKDFLPCSLPPTTTSQLTCFSYFQDSRGEVKLALLPPCNLPLRHYHSAAAPMHLSPRSPQSFLSCGISAHITKMLFACSETRVETLTNRVLVMN